MFLASVTRYNRYITLDVLPLQTSLLQQSRLAYPVDLRFVTEIP